MSRLEDGIRVAASALALTFDAPQEDIAEMVVAFDAMAIHGYGEELAELRRMGDPAAFVREVLR